ncbi:MAG: 2-amino-4-hydroxy-6-hydroxymethyldihydropteridine diphosphokinase [Lachnospiraceae bacterium]|nr:2-amino-4-hydroxy-6-hydroxymethyldihydropteridine diphosphokinase [Lachnospiraceae bacterium]
MDHIFIENLEVFANHGIYEEEASLGQKFIISARLYLDVAPAAKDDDISRSVNYADVCADIDRWMKDNRCRLIETVADRLAKKLLKELAAVREAEVTVKKPWAPVGLPLECVSITVTRKWHTAYLSVGSNMGDKEKYIRGGIDFLKGNDSVRILDVSPLIQTAPYGNVDQDDFLNGAVKLETLLTPHELLDLCHEAENAAKRVRKEHWGPRTLDLDILLYDSLVMDDADLTIPHPDMTNREFVLQPLSRIAPHAFHPVCRMTASQLLGKLLGRNGVEEH